MAYTIVSVTNVRWANAAHNVIACDVVFAEMPGVQPFATIANADTPWGVEIWNNSIAGVYGPIAEYVPNIPPVHEVILSAEQFYTMLETDGQLEFFIDQIETVTPVSKKLTCRNQFNNSTEFTWGQTVIVTVMPKVYGTDWETDVTPKWLAAAGY
jgi:hypothetical protein